MSTHNKYDKFMDVDDVVQHRVVDVVSVVSVIIVIGALTIRQYVILQTADQ